MTTNNAQPNNTTMGDDIGLNLLSHLDKNDSIPDSYQYAKEQKVDHKNVEAAIRSYWAREIIEAKPLKLQFRELTSDGSDVAEKGSPETLMYAAIKAAGPEGTTQKQLLETHDKALVGTGVGLAIKAQWAKFDKASKAYIADDSKADEAAADGVAAALRGDLDAVDDALFAVLKKRKYVRLVNVTAYAVTRGAKFTTSPAKPAVDITYEMLQSGAWKTAEFKPHNITGLGVPPVGGYLHPLLKVRAEYHHIFLEMGFTEMRTNRWVESSFWNFDALFQPQQHPARDAHDTFFISDPVEGPAAHAPPADYVERVRQMHERGGSGSIGYRYEWALEEAKKLILRTHTTAVSSRTLYELAADFKPMKFFSIDRVFRNESLDATHLAEFHQIEGIIVGPNLTLGDLIGTIGDFFKRVGMPKVRFKPAYNPYTEPSMEIFAYHEILHKWVEVGNSGMFRPEMLLPMGLPPNVRAIAWGLGLERPTMIKYGIQNIRDLVGHKLDLDFVRTNPICRIDK